MFNTGYVSSWYSERKMIFYYLLFEIETFFIRKMTVKNAVNNLILKKIKEGVQQ